MTWAIVGITSAVFVWEFRAHPQHLQDILYSFGIVPARYSHPDWALRVGFPIDSYLSLLTSVFLHAGLIHLVGNMWMFWIFGDNVEDRMGRLRFLAFYILCGTVAGLVHWLANPHSTVPAVGASGAIAGVLGAYIVLFPRARVQTFLLLLFWPVFFEVPAVFYILFWFVLQLLSGTAALLGPQQAGGIAWWAHIGGFTAGVVLHRLFIKSRRQPGPQYEISRYRRPLG